jgi:sulfate transport system ATP-binding protein
MSFIGAVNVLSPDATWKAHHHDVPQHANQVFLRPHDIEILAAPTDGTLPAKIKYIIHLGWTIRLELALDNGQEITAHINREQYNELDIRKGQTIHLRAKLIRSFAESPNYSQAIA